eukprot:934525-Pelagomonas_calceolata.AAC.2
MVQVGGWQAQCGGLGPKLAVQMRHTFHSFPVKTRKCTAIVFMRNVANSTQVAHSDGFGCCYCAVAAPTSKAWRSTGHCSCVHACAYAWAPGVGRSSSLGA